MICLTHSAVQIPHDLHQFWKKTTLYNFFSFFLVCDDLAAAAPFLRFGVGLVLVLLTILLTAFVVNIFIMATRLLQKKPHNESTCFPYSYGGKQVKSFNA
jgi:hypothetical protein